MEERRLGLRLFLYYFSREKYRKKFGLFGVFAE